MHRLTSPLCVENWSGETGKNLLQRRLAPSLVLYAAKEGEPRMRVDLGNQFILLNRQRSIPVWRTTTNRIELLNIDVS